jgi:3-carboxy-cis,cis-muconate cycloisomerase
MTVSAFDHPLLSQLVGDDEVAAFFGFEAELFAAIAFETALAESCADAGLITQESASVIGDRLRDFVPDLPRLAAATRRDGLMVPDLVAQMRSHVGAPHGHHLHYGATSQDVTDTGLVLRIAEALGVIHKRIAALLGALDEAERRFGAHKLTGVTRMQRALPISVGDRMRTWIDPLERHATRLAELRPRLMVVQLGGAVGTRHAFNGKGDDVARTLAKRLGLGLPAHPWHAERDNLAEFANWLSLITGGLGKMGQDLLLMSQNALGEASFAEGGGSSAMPHKQNPVAAEALVALARFNAALLSAMHDAQIHENERSGSAWTLEWLVLPQMVVAASGSLRRAYDMMLSVTALGR